jgi:hypothetical protein
VNGANSMNWRQRHALRRYLKQRYFTEPENHALAEIIDAQGFGGSQRREGTLVRTTNDRDPSQ